ncbi:MULTISPECIES: 5-(carboxyamino)imidazole ribonucleotide synthase [Brevibacillus]|jgi:5-(carboxyamino)imidazole ribonucleotide synthase|uniref:N5-carboxyaminoimidazole ribonucleotide synthase n=1 Tax=Brevibacillus aydinogluensis TaxID=927786 RepID=A0AA48MBQ0_9BACL|nr:MULTISPECIES: 5-(carboxyamino)imidazole ribonucleotide synthase [Brevibacillus]MBR8658961.1 5-(carboxyamino)imidazole ribonucleotide synthase [Brevibacillus sp. NL20B1]MDT3418210.1 5-(carboxyamino)imidazole ribonucleotide synthase [Brevibacillus aydinogluensis]NNV04589.1 5-(carboxyamino)imidazole ribonucleotide synthase [Brevibacillus sp. MCWH]CAJ1004265.1 5-(carboxyamino)imidazole ribonucleotide synthase [Brevibacillus aydinogluensis]
MTNRTPIKPGATIGILGGGQLGRMIALAGRAMGYRFVTMDPTEDAPCGQAADRQIVARYDDVDAAMQLAKISDVISYEFENVDARVAEVLESQAYVPQGSRLLRITQNRIREKTAIAELGIPVAPFRVIDSLDSLRAAIADLGLPAVMKTATGGYDGKGQWVLRSEAELAEAYDTLFKAGTELIVEQFVPFQLELSVIAARNPSGELAVFPAAENVHRENILHLSIVPARVPDDIRQRAEAIARTIAERLDVVGLIAVEMFLTANGELYVNELAPRPHNSGHYTMDACVTSQFEQHVRAVCDLPLGSTELLSPVVMVNILGEHLQPVLDRIDQLPRTAKLHLYGKHESKPKRKMGHINVLAPSVEEALAQIDRLEIWTNQAEVNHD